MTKFYDENIKLKELIDVLAQKIVDEQYLIQPEFSKYGDIGYQKSINDAKYHLSFLAESIEFDSFELFENYIHWNEILFKKRNLPENTIKIFLELTIKIINSLDNLDTKYKEKINIFITNILNNLNSDIEEEKSFISENNPYREVLKYYMELLFEGKRNEASKLILNLANSNIAIVDIYKYIFRPSQLEVGRLWHNNQISVAQEHYFSAAAQLIMSQLYDKIFLNKKNGYKMIGACINGELHEMGIRMITDYFESCGWDTYYLGANVPSSDLLKAINDINPHLVAISATLSINIGKVKELIDLIRSEEKIKNVKILVGGFPFYIKNDLYKKVGADGCSYEFEDTEKLAIELVR